jgi:hypothetical protein
MEEKQNQSDFIFPLMDIAQGTRTFHRRRTAGPGVHETRPTATQADYDRLNSNIECALTKIINDNRIEEMAISEKDRARSRVRVYRRARRVVSEPPTFRLPARRNNHQDGRRGWSSRIQGISSPRCYTKLRKSDSLGERKEDLSDQVKDAPFFVSPCLHNRDMLQISLEDRIKKLENFFGAVVDVSVLEIERRGLKALLHSRVPLTYFLQSLVLDLSSENLVS